MPLKRRRYKDTGIIIKRANNGEDALMLNLYCRDGGRRRVYANLNNRGVFFCRAGLEKGSVLTYIAEEAKHVDFMVKVEKADTSRPLGNDPMYYYGLSAVLELLEKTTMLGDKNEEMYELAETTLGALRKNPGAAALITAVYDTQVLQLSGCGVSLLECASCGKDLSDKQCLFGARRGGKVCPGCLEKEAGADYRRIGRNVSAWLSWFSMNGKRPVGLSREGGPEACRLVAEALGELLEVELKAHGSLDDIGKVDRGVTV